MKALQRIGCVAALVIVLPQAGISQIDTLPFEQYELGDILIRDTYEPAGLLAGSREWQPDSLTLANAQAGNLSDIFREMPSVAAKRYAPGGLATPTMRGTGAGHTQVYWDGIPLNSPMLGQQDLSLGAGSLFDGVSVRYGGNSLMLGSGGIGGAIDLTNEPGRLWSRTNKLTLREQAGAFASNSSNIDLGISSLHFQSKTGIYLNTARNNFPFRNPSLPGEPVQRLENAGFLQGGGKQEFMFRTRRSEAIARVWVLRSDRDVPPTMLTVNALEHQQDVALRTMASWRTEIKPYRSIILKGALLEERTDYTNQVAGISAPSGFRRWVGQADYADTYSLGRLRLKAAGLRWMYDRSWSQGFGEPQFQNTLSGFASGVYRIREVNSISALVREEWVDGKWSPLMGYLAGSVRATNRLRINASGARNYRFPTLNDRFWVPGGNPFLRPELSHSAELSMFYFRDKKYGDPAERKLKVEVACYYNRVRDWILWLPGTGAIWQPENVADVTAMGLELIANHEGRVGQLRYALRANYTLSSTRDGEGHQLIYTPQHIGSGRVAMQWRNWSVQYFQDLNGRRFTTKDNGNFLGAFTTADVSLGWEGGLSQGQESGPRYAQRTRKGSLHLQAGARNIFNAQYQTVAWRPMPGRAWYVRLDVTLSRTKWR